MIARRTSRRRRMQRLTRCSVGLFLLALLGAWSAPDLAAQVSTVRCESRGNSQVQCPIPANSQVAVEQTLSQQPCSEDRNWGVGSGFIWVSGGCRADFTVSPATYGQGQGGNASANPNQLRACRSEAD